MGGALFASSAPTIPSFTFGVQAGVVSGGGSFGETQKNGASTGASPAKRIRSVTVRQAGRMEMRRVFGEKCSRC